MAERTYRPDAGRYNPLIAEITATNPELVAGYFVMALLVDGSVELAHNTQCAACCVDTLVQVVQQNEDLACDNAKRRKWYRKR